MSMMSPQHNREKNYKYTIKSVLIWLGEVENPLHLKLEFEVYLWFILSK